MNRIGQKSLPIIITFSIAILICIFIGKSITTVPAAPVVIILGLFMFFVSFTATDFAMILLIFAMLLSPEFALGAVSKQRAIVVRIDDLFILAFILAWFARITVDKKLHVITKSPINMFIGFYIISFLIPTVIGMITTDVHHVSGLFYMLKYIEYFAVFYLAARIIKSKKQVKTFLKAFLVTFAIVNIYAVTQIGVAGRVSAPFEGAVGEPNTLGGYQVLLLGIIIGLLTHDRSLRLKWPLFILAIFSLVPFTFTLSRSSYMAIVPMYFTLIFFNKGRTRNILIGLMFLAIITSIFFFPQVIKERIGYTFVAEEQETIVPVVIGGISLGPSTSARIHDWLRLFEEWKKKPFIGYGVTGAGFVDSQFIRVLVETGLVGLSAFILLLWSIGQRALRIYRHSKDDMFRGLAIGFLAGHIGMIAHAISANTFILIRIMEPYWFLAAVVMMIPKIEQSQQPKVQPVVNTAGDNGVIRNSSFLIRNGK